MSTSKKKKKSEWREYESPPPILCKLKELDVLLDKWIAVGFSNLIIFLESPLKKNRLPPT